MRIWKILLIASAVVAVSARANAEQVELDCILAGSSYVSLYIWVDFRQGHRDDPTDFERAAHLQLGSDNSHDDRLD
ncbi:MAG: hypothetical protein ACLQUZ_07640 [Rhizomicrobium sp.]